MRKKYGKLIIICLVLFVFLTGCKKSAGENGNGENPLLVTNSSQVNFVTEEKPESMTLMIYMVGSDLEAATAAATNDMNEMADSGVNLSKVKILVYTGGSPKWHNDSVEIPTDANAVFELTKNGYQKITEFEALSMGESESLSRFLKFGYENYKSDSYALILWDHGNGPVMGYGSDIQYGKDALTLPEIETALLDSPFGKDQKLEFIGFDACLMSSVELACMVDDYAKYMIASQEVEPGFGWNYSFLKNFCKTDTGSMIQGIVDNYISYSEEYFAQNEFFKSEVTLSVVDLSYAEQLEAAVDALFGAAADNVSGDFSQLALERVETRAFGRATTGSEYDLVDMQALMNSMNDSYVEETAAVQDILEQMVVYNASNTVESCGLSLYYPYYNKKYYEASWKTSYEELGLLPNYIEYLERYGQIWLGTDMKEYFSGKLVAQEGESGTYTLQLTEEQASVYADGGFYILRRMGEDIYSIVYYSQNVTNDNGLLTANFDGRIIYYGDDWGFKGIPVTRVLDEVNGVTRYAVFPNLAGSVDSLDFSNTLMCRMVLNVNEESGEITVSDFSPNGTEEIQTGKKPQIDLDDWVRIQFFEIRGRYLTRDEDGRIVQYWEWPEGDWIIAQELSIADGLNFTYEKLYDDGNEYYLMFDIMDSQGNQYSSELYPVTLEERPEEEEPKPIDAGTLDGSSALIFEEKGVKLYLDLVRDDDVGQTSYCFRAENDNDFPVRIYVQDFVLNDQIICTDSLVYIIAEPHSTSYDFAKEISDTCMYEKVDILDALQLTADMWNVDNDQTLLRNQKYQISFSENAKAEQKFIVYKGALAKEQLLMEDKGIQVKLLGAGYQLNISNADPNQDYSELTGVLRYENISDTTQTICMEGMEINGVALDSGEYSSWLNYLDEVELEPGRVYYYQWNVDADYFIENGISEITSITNTINGNVLTIDLEK